MVNCALTVTNHRDTPPEVTENYIKCVSFMAAYLSQQDGADGKDTVELFDEFKSNVCLAMKGTPGGNG